MRAPLCQAPYQEGLDGAERQLTGFGALAQGRIAIENQAIFVAEK